MKKLLVVLILTILFLLNCSWNKDLKSDDLTNIYLSLPGDSANENDNYPQDIVMYEIHLKKYKGEKYESDQN